MPLRAIAHFGDVGDVPFAVAVHVIVSLESVPVADPVTVRLPPQRAVNVPDAPVADAVVIFHLKSEHVLVSTVSDETELHAPVSDPSVKVPFNGLTELAPLHANDPRLMTCTVEKLLTFCMGRAFGAPDANFMRALGITAEAYGGHLRATVEAIVMSAVFRNRRAGTAPAPVGG